MWDYTYVRGKKESEFNIQSAEIINKHCKDIVHTIELGCGTGQLTKLIQDYNPGIFSYLIDNSISSRDYVHAYFKDNNIMSMADYQFIKRDIFEYKIDTYPPTIMVKYDFVFSSGLIEHFKDEKLKTICDIHKKFSRKYIACIVPFANEENIKKAQTESHIKKYGYEKPMTEQELDNLFIDNIFKKIHGETFYKNDKLLIGVYSK